MLNDEAGMMKAKDMGKGESFMPSTAEDSSGFGVFRSCSQQIQSWYVMTGESPISLFKRHHSSLISSA
jgi:hypothetical protein